MRQTGRPVFVQALVTEAIKAYGILNPLPAMAFGPEKDDPDVIAELQKYVAGGKPNPSWQGIAFPGTFILEPSGRVQSRFFEDYYVERATFSNIMLRLGQSQAPVSATRVTGAHLDLVSYATDTEIAAGNRVAVVVEVTPHPGVHVYAPGAANYRTVAVSITPHSDLRVLPATYPASEPYVFKPLNERVPVYQKPFALVQELVLEGTSAAQAARRGQSSVTVQGALQYQACDDTTCFNPLSVPLSWTFALRGLVTQRATPAPQ